MNTRFWAVLTLLFIYSPTSVFALPKLFGLFGKKSREERIQERAERKASQSDRANSGDESTDAGGRRRPSSESHKPIENGEAARAGGSAASSSPTPAAPASTLQNFLLQHLEARGANWELLGKCRVDDNGNVRNDRMALGISRKGGKLSWQLVPAAATPNPNENFNPAFGGSFEDVKADGSWLTSTLATKAPGSADRIEEKSWMRRSPDGGAGFEFLDRTVRISPNGAQKVSKTRCEIDSVRNPNDRTVTPIGAYLDRLPKEAPYTTRRRKFVQSGPPTKEELANLAAKYQVDGGSAIYLNCLSPNAGIAADARVPNFTLFLFTNPANQKVTQRLVPGALGTTAEIMSWAKNGATPFAGTANGFQGDLGDEYPSAGLVGGPFVVQYRANGTTASVRIADKKREKISKEDLPKRESGQYCTVVKADPAQLKYAVNGVTFARPDADSDSRDDDRRPE